MPQIFGSRLTEMCRFQVVKREVVLGRVQILDLELAQALPVPDAKLIRSMILQGGGGGFIYRNGHLTSLDKHDEALIRVDFDPGAEEANLAEGFLKASHQDNFNLVSVGSRRAGRAG